MFSEHMFDTVHRAIITLTSLAQIDKSHSRVRYRLRYLLELWRAGYVMLTILEQLALTFFPIQ